MYFTQKKVWDLTGEKTGKVYSVKIISLFLGKNNLATKSGKNFKEKEFI